jgi:hypothetical protein
MLSSRWIISILAPIGVCLAAPPVATQKGATPAPSVSSNASPDLSNRLQTYFLNAKKELGALEPWQQKLFDEEALPEYQRYMRGYRLTGNANNPGISADIDFESLRQFLRFYAPKSLKREKPSIVAVLKPQTNCSKCVSSLPEVKTLVASRLERRGFKVIWVTPTELGDASLTGAELEAAANQNALQKKAVGAMVVRWQNAVGDADAMHPDERHYSIHSSLDIRDVSKSQAQLEVAANGSFERSAGKLIADAFTELGARMSELEVSQSELKRDEIVIDVVGIRSFAQYEALKNGLQSAIKTGQLEEQKVSRGHAVFAVFSDAPAQKIQQAIAGAKAEGVRIAPPTLATTPEGNEIHIELLEAQASPAPTQAAPAQPAPSKPQVEQPEGDPEA